MKQNASGRPGPNIRTSTLHDAITWYRREDTKGFFAEIGPRPVAVFKRGVNYALVLEGIIPRGPGFTGKGGGGVYPFMAKSLDAAK